MNRASDLPYVGRFLVHVRLTSSYILWMNPMNFPLRWENELKISLEITWCFAIFICALENVRHITCQDKWNGKWYWMAKSYWNASWWTPATTLLTSKYCPLVSCKQSEILIVSSDWFKLELQKCWLAMRNNAYFANSQINHTFITNWDNIILAIVYHLYELKL